MEENLRRRNDGLNFSSNFAWATSYFNFIKIPDVASKKVIRLAWNDPAAPFDSRARWIMTDDRVAEEVRASCKKPTRPRIELSERWFLSRDHRFSWPLLVAGVLVCGTRDVYTDNNYAKIRIKY